MEQRSRTPYELEVGTLDEFLELLDRRMEDPEALGEGLPRRAVAVAEMFDQRSTEIGVARVRRYVRASFLWRGDVVTLEIASSHGYEPNPDPAEARRVGEAQAELARSVRAAVGERIAERGLSVEFPVVRGMLHPASDPRTRKP